MAEKKTATAKKRYRTVRKQKIPEDLVNVEGLDGVDVGSFQALFSEPDREAASATSQPVGLDAQDAGHDTSQEVDSSVPDHDCAGEPTDSDAVFGQLERSLVVGSSPVTDSARRSEDGDSPAQRQPLKRRTFLAALRDGRNGQHIKNSSARESPDENQWLPEQPLNIGVFARLDGMLRSGDPNLQMRALDELKKEERDAPASVLRAVCELTTHKQESIRCRAVLLLGESAETELVLPALTQAVTDSHHTVRRNVAKALGKLGDPRAAEVLITILGDENSTVRQHAAEALGRLGEKCAAESLIAALKDSDQLVRQAAAQALRKLGDQPNGKLAMGSLDAVDQHNGAHLPPTTAAAVGQPADAKTVADLVDQLKADELSVRKAAALALGGMGEAAIEPLIAALNSREEIVRRKAVQVLASLGDKRAIGPLAAILDKGDGALKWEALRALRHIGTKEADEAILKYKTKQRRMARIKKVLSRVPLSF